MKRSTVLDSLKLYCDLIRNPYTTYYDPGGIDRGVNLQIIPISHAKSVIDNLSKNLCLIHKKVGGFMRLLAPDQAPKTPKTLEFQRVEPFQSPIIL